MIEQKFNSLFFEKPLVTEELRFLELLLKREGERQERYGLHASAMLVGEKEFCLREQVLSLFFKQNQGENIQAGLKRIFAEGDSIHQKWQRLFIRGKIGSYKNMDRPRFNKKYDLSFTPDAQIDILQCEDVPVEIKSMNTYAFKHATGHPSGEKQLNFYCVFLQKPWGILLLEDKNTQEFKVFIIEKSVKKARPYLDRLVIIQDAKNEFLESGTLPAKKCKSCDEKKAMQCNMRDACWKIGKGRKKLETK